MNHDRQTLPEGLLQICLRMNFKEGGGRPGEGRGTLTCSHGNKKPLFKFSMAARHQVTQAWPSPCSCQEANQQQAQRQDLDSGRPPTPRS